MSGSEALNNLRRNVILMEAVQKRERDIWRKAVYSVLLPSKAKDVDQEVERIRNTSLRGLPVVGSEDPMFGFGGDGNEEDLT